jgi:hypothetical protein
MGITHLCTRTRTSSTQVYKGNATRKTLNDIGYDVFHLNAGDFHLGYVGLSAFIDGLDPSVSALASNIDVSSNHFLSGNRTGTAIPRILPWTVKQVNGRAVGIIGLVSPQLLNITTGAENCTVNEIGGLNHSQCQETQAPWVRFHVGTPELYLAKAIFDMKRTYPLVNIIIAMVDFAYADAVSKFTADIDIVLLTGTEFPASFSLHVHS